MICHFVFRRLMRNAGTVRFIAPAGLHPARLTLCIGNIPFDDEIVTINEFAQDQTASELQVNGDSFTQSEAILRYAGRLSGSYPSTSPFMALQVDEILHVLSEVQAKMNYSRSSNGDLHAELVNMTIPRYASLIEARLQRLNDLPVYQFYCNKVLIHEIALYCWVQAVRGTMTGNEIEKHKCILKAESKVANHPRVKQLKLSQSSSKYPKLKLTYFPFPGRAEPIRLALFIGGVAFEDERIDADELNRRRLSLPFNQLPVLAVDGGVTSQALAILRYVGMLSGLYPLSNTEEAFRIDEVFSLIDEFYSSYTWNASYFENDPEEQMKLRTVLADETLPKTLGFLEKQVSRWAGSHSIGDRFTVADLAIYSLLWTFQSGRVLGVPVSVVAPYNKLLQVYHLVATHPKVLEWNSIVH